MYLVKLRQKYRVDVTAITIVPQNLSYGSLEFCQRLMKKMQENGIRVIVKDEGIEHFVIIDDDLVWHR